MAPTLRPEQLNTVVTAFSCALMVKVTVHFIRRSLKYRQPMDYFGLASAMSGASAAMVTLLFWSVTDLNCSFRSYFGSINYGLSFTLIYIHFLLKSTLLNTTKGWRPMQKVALLTIPWFVFVTTAYVATIVPFRTDEGICQNTQNFVVTINQAVAVNVNNVVLMLCFIMPLVQLMRSGNLEVDAQKYQRKLALVKRVTSATGISAATSCLLYTFILAKVTGKYTIMLFYAEWAISIWAASFSLPLPNTRNGAGLIGPGASSASQRSAGASDNSYRLDARGFLASKGSTTTATGSMNSPSKKMMPGSQLNSPL